MCQSTRRLSYAILLKIAVISAYMFDLLEPYYSNVKGRIISYFKTQAFPSSMKVQMTRPVANQNKADSLYK
jgi:hypothetical protein